ncbi:MAG: hypothetical protein GY841_10065 [FCB group bacterium]|nr:hypothetical protein [FCB group bacterium]
MITTVVGSYPKIPSIRDGVNLRKAINDAEKGRIDSGRLEEVYRLTIRRCINDQQSAGIDIITDGQIRWSELSWPLASSLNSVRAGGLRRFYDNNVYYRRPQIIDLMSLSKDIIVDEYRFAAENSVRPVKAVLCGPITFCDLAENHYYKSFNRLAEAMAEILAEEVHRLQKAGCRYIQLDEPSLPLHPRRMKVAAELYSEIFKGFSGEGGVFIYFNSIRPIARSLSSLPVKFLGLDLVSHPRDIDLVPSLDDCVLIAGLFDGRNIMLENEKQIRADVDRLSRKISPERMMLSPSCGLEFLPQKYAQAKMNKLCEVARKLNSVKAR